MRVPTLTLKPQTALTFLRIAIGIVFFWFGILKVLGYNPVEEIIAGTFLYLSTGPGFLLLGIFEVLIGLALLFNKFVRTAHILLILHLAGTFLTLVVDPGLMYDPYFPMLTLEGEFVVKNLVFEASGIALLAHTRHKKGKRDQIM